MALGVRTWLEAVTAAIKKPWKRDTAREAELPGYHCFARDKTDDLPEVRLYLTPVHDGLKVTNIVPADRSLTTSQYNTVLHEFYTAHALPCAAPAQVRVELSSDTFRLEDAFSVEALRKLRGFSDNANKETGIGHPLDRERWLEFVVAAHEAGSEIDEATLSHLLEEELGWPEDVASDLGRDYRIARDALQFYDTHQAEATAA